MISCVVRRYLVRDWVTAWFIFLGWLRCCVIDMILRLHAGVIGRFCGGQIAWFCERAILCGHNFVCSWLRDCMGLSAQCFWSHGDILCIFILLSVFEYRFYCLTIFSPGAKQYDGGRGWKSGCWFSPQLRGLLFFEQVLVVDIPGFQVVFIPFLFEACSSLFVIDTRDSHQQVSKNEIPLTITRYPAL